MRSPRQSARTIPKHCCPGTGCRIYLPVERLACGSHWHALPVELRDELVRTLRRDRRRHLTAYLQAISLLKAMPAAVTPRPLTSRVERPLVVQPTLFEETPRP